MSDLGQIPELLNWTQTKLLTPRTMNKTMVVVLSHEDLELFVKCQKSNWLNTWEDTIIS